MRWLDRSGAMAFASRIGVEGAKWDRTVLGRHQREDTLGKIERRGSANCLVNTLVRSKVEGDRHERPDELAESASPESTPARRGFHVNKRADKQTEAREGKLGVLISILRLSCRSSLR